MFALPGSGQDFSPPASKAIWFSCPTEEHDHARQCQFRASGTRTYAMEQRETEGAKPPLRQKQVWAIRTKLQIEKRTRDLALFNLAIDSKLRGSDVFALKVEDVAPNGYSVDRASVHQKKTGRPVRFELTEQTRQAVDDYIRTASKKPGEFMFTACRMQKHCMTTQQSRPEPYQHVLCRTPEPNYAYVDAPLYPADKRIQQEIPKLLPFAGVVFRLVQLDAEAQSNPNDARDCCRSNRQSNDHDRSC